MYFLYIYENVFFVYIWKCLYIYICIYIYIYIHAECALVYRYPTQTFKCQIPLHKSSPSPTCWSWGILLRLKKIKRKHCHNQVIFWHQIASLIFLGSLRVHDGKPNEIKQGIPLRKSPRNWTTQILNLPLGIAIATPSIKIFKYCANLNYDKELKTWNLQIWTLQSTVLNNQNVKYVSFSASPCLIPPFWKMFDSPARFRECSRSTSNVVGGLKGLHVRREDSEDEAYTSWDDVSDGLWQCHWQCFAAMHIWQEKLAWLIWSGCGLQAIIKLKLGIRDFYPQKTDLAMEHPPWMKMYFLLKLGIFQPAIWVFGSVWFQIYGSFCCLWVESSMIVCFMMQWCMSLLTRI